MTIGFTADRYKKLSVSFILRLLRWTGVSFSEVTVSVFHRPVKALRSSRGMRLGLHLPNFGNCGYDFSSRKSRETIDAVLNQIQRYGNRFDFQYAVFHPPEADTSPETFAFYVQNLQRVKIPLVLENIRSYDINRFKAFYRRMQQELEPQLQGVCLDIPHAYITGEDWVDFYRTMEDHIKVIHLSDCIGTTDSHLPFGMDGHLHLEEILEKLRQLGFNGILNLEMQPPSLQDLNAYFQTYLRAKEYLQPDGMQKTRRRMKRISLLGRGLLRNKNQPS